MALSDDLGFVILNPECNPHALRLTATTIRDNLGCPHLCVVGKEHTIPGELKKHSRLAIGGETITSLIDAGMEAMEKPWVMVVMAGSYLRVKCLRKYEMFLTGPKEILYPVVDRKWLFEEASLNGMLMSRKAIEEIGPFGDHNRSISLVKLLWAADAISYGYKFKAIVGARII